MEGAFPRNAEFCLDGRITCEFQDPEHGGYADVYEGTFENRKVAIKVVRVVKLRREKLLRRLWREYLAWYRLSHPNILECLGYSYGFPTGNSTLPSLISPWMVNGTLTSYLETNPDEDRIALIVGVANGLSYLHGRAPVIVHGDLRAGNILVSDQGVPCLTDFGLSRIVEEVRGMTTSSDIAGSVRWMSPELFQGEGNATVHSDVWAYGMTVLEVLSGERPYHDVKSDLIVIGRVRDSGDPPKRPESPVFDDRVWDACKRCWSLDPAVRPSMEEVISLFSPALRQHETSIEVQESSSALIGEDLPAAPRLDEGRTPPVVNEEQPSPALHEKQQAPVMVHKEPQAPTTSEHIAPVETEGGPPPSPTEGEHPSVVVDEGLPAAVNHTTTVNQEISTVNNVDPLRSKTDHISANNNRDPDSMNNINIHRGHLLKHRDVVRCFGFSVDGKYLAVGNLRTVEIYDTSTGSNIWILSPDILGHLSCICFSPDGKLLATGDKDGKIWVWKIDNKEGRKMLNEHSSRIIALEFSNDSRFLVSTGRMDRQVRIWNVETLRDNVLRSGVKSTKISNWSKMVAFSPSGHFVAVARNAHVYLWDAQKNVLLERLIGRAAMITSVTFTPDGNGVVSGTSSGNVKLWNISPFLRNRGRDTPLDINVDASLGLVDGQGEKGSRCVAQTTYTGEDIPRVAVSRDGQLVISSSGAGRVRFWSPHARNSAAEPLNSGKGPIAVSVDLSHTSGLVATVGETKESTRIWKYSVSLSN